MVCDFCMGDKDLKWKYESKDFSIGVPAVGGVNYAGAWAACDECSACIECEDWDSVIDRALAYSVPLEFGPYPMDEEVKFLRDSLVMLYKMFRYCRIGGRVLV